MLDVMRMRQRLARGVPLQCDNAVCEVVATVHAQAR